MKFDPHRNQQKYESWKLHVSKNGIDGLNKFHSKLLFSYICDMEVGRNVAKGTKKGSRSYIRLNAIRSRLPQIVQLLEERGVKNIEKLTEDKIISLFDDMEKGKVMRRDGQKYKTNKDHIKDFKAFWHWFMKVEKKKRVELKDICEDLGTTKEENSFVYFTLEQLKKMQNYLSADEQLRVLFMFDTIIRSPTELMNLKVSDISSDFNEITIRNETAKTYGRTIKLLLCKEGLQEYIKRNELKESDFLFQFSAPVFNFRLKNAAISAFGDKITKGGKPFSKISMYDFRHSGACHWRTGAYRTKIDALMYRGGWNNLEMLNYYTKKLGMKDSIEKEDLLVEVDKNEIEKKLDEIEKVIPKIIKTNEELKQMYNIAAKTANLLMKSQKVKAPLFPVEEVEQ